MRLLKTIIAILMAPHNHSFLASTEQIIPMADYTERATLYSNYIRRR